MDSRLLVAIAPRVFAQVERRVQPPGREAGETTPMMAPPAMSPDEKRTPGPESASADSRSAGDMRRSTSQRITPPRNIAAEVEMGR